jgi:hypothetical protein
VKEILPFPTCECKGVLSDTGCTVTPCSALSKASCRSLDDEREAGLLPEEVLVGRTTCEKSPSEAAVAMAVDKC